jgi:type VI secretion system secreted protein Hcp
MAVDAFLMLDGIKGESTDDKHKDEIDVLAWSWGMSQSGTFGSGPGGGAGKVDVQDISFTKYVDASSPELMTHCCNGKHIGKGTLTLRKAGEKPLDYLIIKFEKLLVSSLSTGGSNGEERLTENVTFNFGNFEVEYQAQDDKGGPKGGPVKASWDLQANKKK